MHFWRTNQDRLYILALIGCAVLLVLPQIILRSLVISSDALFHFNRFYDTAMQIKEGNLHYFVSFYGFQQSGRIVHALYGPIVAYLHGGLVLLSPNWFCYQVSANFLLYLLAGYGMYGLLRTCKIRPATAFLFSVVYLTTYAIQYWMMRQGFSSWGAAVLPLCLIPYMKWMRTYRFDAGKVGICVALAVQVHLMTALFVVVIYAIGLIGIICQKKQMEWGLCRQIVQAVAVFLVLTANIWLGMLLIYQGNSLLAPFINQTMYRSTITYNSTYWILTPLLLIFGLLYTIGEGMLSFSKQSFAKRMVLCPLLLFVLLSTNIVPWKFLIQRQFFLAELIQFPFRFFIPATTLMMVYLAEQWQTKVRRRSLYVLVVICSLGHGLLLNTEANLRWHKAADPFQTRKHTTRFFDEPQELKAAFHYRDMQTALLLIQKGTPDYVPIYAEDNRNKYEAYTQEIILPHADFEKVVEQDQLTVSWQGKEGQVRQVPVIVYDRTTVHYNGAYLASDKLQVTSIGAPLVKELEGLNQLTISYPQPHVFLGCLCLVLLLWFLVIMYYGKKTIHWLIL